MKYLKARTPVVNPLSDTPFKATTKSEDNEAFVFVDAISMFVLNAFPKEEKRSLSDDHHAFRLLKRLGKCARSKAHLLELEDADYEWLLKQFENRGTTVFNSPGSAWAVLELLKSARDEAEDSDESESGKQEEVVIGSKIIKRA